MLLLTLAETSNIRLEDVDLIFKDGRNPVIVARELARTSHRDTIGNTVPMSNNQKDETAIETYEDKV